MCRWIDGEDLENVLPHLSQTEQYQLGIEAGHLLAKVHACAPLHSLPDWESHFNAKLDRKIARALSCPEHIPGRNELIAYINANRYRLVNRPVTLQHGDFHLGNLLLQPNGHLALIDLNRFDTGDPWEDSTASSGMPRPLRHLPAGGSMATSSVRFRPRSSRFWHCTSLPMPCPVSLGPFHSVKRK
jgi:aminoglycoside phosphotransferase (APT) family kinase protein